MIKTIAICISIFILTSVIFFHVGRGTDNKLSDSEVNKKYEQLDINIKQKTKRFLIELMEQLNK